MHTNIYQEIESNDRLTWKLLCLYAYVGDTLRTSSLQRFAQAESVKMSTLEAAKKCLLDKGLLEQGDYEWAPFIVHFRIAKVHYLPVLLLLFTKHTDWIRPFMELQCPRAPFYVDLQTIALMGLKGEYDEIKSGWFSQQILPYLVPAITDPRLAGIINRMPAYLFPPFLETAVVCLSENDLLDQEKVLPRLLKAHLPKLDKETGREMGEMLALYRYYSHGEYTPPAQPPKTLYTLILEAVHAAHRKEYEKAYDCFEAALKIRNRGSKEKNVFYGMLNCYFLVMTYIHQGAKGNEKLGRLLRKKDFPMTQSMWPAHAVASCFASTERIFPLYNLQRLRNGSGTLRLFGFLFGKYGGAKTEEALSPEKFIPRQAVMRHELSAYLPLTDAERKELRDLYGDAPLLTSIRKKQPWELVLEQLMEQEEEKEKQGDVRLAYIIRYSREVEVREQNRLKSGAWGSGKPLSAARYQSGLIDCMDERDRRIWQNWGKRGNYQLRIADALPELVGCDRVFTGTFAPFTPVSVTSEQPYLVIERREQELVVSANFPDPEKEKNCYETDRHIIVEKDKENYVVIPLEGKQRVYYKQLLSLHTLPLEAETQLQALFAKVGSLVEVHSPIIKEGSNLESLEGGSAICLQVHPYEQHFHLNIYAKPLPEGKSLFKPGEGTTLAVDEKEGKRYQLKRRLAQERKNYGEIVAYIEEATEQTVYDDGVDLAPEQLLDLLEHIRPLQEHYFVEWPEGEKMRLKRSALPAQWKVDLKASGEGWFELEGEIPLDDDTLMDIARLLELVGKNKGRYIRLNETDYLRLSDNLRKQLGRLEAIAVKNHGKMQIARLQAALMGRETLEGELKIGQDEALEQLRDRIAQSKELKIKVPAKLKATLRDYQLEGYQWIARLNSWGAGACLADDMGLGKTVQTIAYLLHTARKGASLVVAPASVVANWRRELERFAPALHVCLLNEAADRQKAVKKAKASDVIVSTYGLLTSEEECLTGKRWNVVCLDEAHVIKNRDTKTSACAMKLQAENRLILTGTPVQNHLGELWNLFRFINPGVLGSYEQFREKFINPIELNHDRQRQQQLNRIVHPFMLRRTKQEVVEELPDKEEINLAVELSEREMAVYETIRRRAKELIATEGNRVNVAVLTEITKLRQAACCASLVEKGWTGGCSKAERLIELMGELKEGGNRALIFSQFTSFFQVIREALDHAGEEYLYLDGSTPVKQREALVREFQEGNCPFFLISLKAGGLGLNLTGANYIIHLDPWWNPAIEQQATDRAYRIGQEQKVTAYHLIASHTIEEKILRLHDTKRNLSDALLSGTDMSHKLTAEELMEILATPEEDQP